MYKLIIFYFLLSFITLPSISCQDPADGWMAYAVGAIPSNYQRITRLEMTWKVGANPKPSNAFFSPWFGMDPEDNLNLIQPVNPWSGDSWSMYTEYYQWEPENNMNSREYEVKSGQTLHGSILYNSAQDSYSLKQTIVETGETSFQTVKCQNGKKYTIPYVVYEKTFPCDTYPPDQIVTFTNIIVECDGQDCTKEVKWRADVKDDNCEMQAHIDEANNSISITWNTNASSKYDKMNRAELHVKNMKGWAFRNPIILKKAQQAKFLEQ